MDDNEKTEEEIQEDRYRYGGFRYSMRAPDKWGPDDIIPEYVSLFAFPTGSHWGDDPSPEDS